MNTDPDIPAPATQPHTGWFTGGCFWTSDAIFRHVRDVQDVVAGYLWCKGGLPIQQSVDRHLVERIEAVQVSWDPGAIGAADLVRILIQTVSPSLGAWGEQLDEMSGLRSAALFANEQDAQEGLVALDQLREEAAATNAPFFTQVAHLSPNFVPAGDSDQGFFLARPSDGYCSSLIVPKLERIRKTLPHLMTTNP